MDIIPFDGLPYPAMPPALRVLVALAKYAVFGVVPLVIPSVLEDIPIPIDRIPRHQGTDSPTSRRSRTRSATSSTSTRARCPA